MSSERHLHFVETISMLFSARHAVQDPFFSHRFAQEIAAIVSAHVQYHTASEKEPALRSYIQNLKKTQTLLEETMYLRIGIGAMPFAAASEKLLEYTKDLLKDVPIVRSEKIPAPVPALADPQDMKQPASPSSELRLNSTREKILAFVRSGPERRPKEIIEQFSALSDRTIKRSLKELSEEGLIIKKSENRAVYYSAV